MWGTAGLGYRIQPRNTGFHFRVGGGALDGPPVTPVTPRSLYPAFHGCYDWHSSVHGHWLLVRILNTDPATPYREAILKALGRSFTAANIAGELLRQPADGYRIVAVSIPGYGPPRGECLDIGDLQIRF